MIEEDLIVDIDFNPDGKGKVGKALCDSVRRETYDYLVNKGRTQVLEEELVYLIYILNTNDRFRIGEIEKRIAQIKKEMKK